MKVKFLSFLFVSAVFLFACNENNSDNNKAGEIITLTPHSWTQNLDGSTTSFASLRGSWTGGMSGDELGFFFSTSQINTGSLASDLAQGVEKYVAKGTENNIFTCEITGLDMGVKYYFVAYIKLASGELKFGEVKDFFVNNLDIRPAGKPAANGVADSYKLATVTITPGNFGAGPSLGEDAAFLKIYETGIYFWRDGAGSLATAARVSLQADRAKLDLIKEGDNVPLDLTPLISQTKYNFVPFVQIAFCKTFSDTIRMEAVLGDQGSFTTGVAGNLQPEVTTVDATNIAQTSVTLSGKVTDWGDDLASELGFYRATTDVALDGHNEADKVTATAMNWWNGAFTCDLTGLIDNRKYYYQSYMIWRKGMADEETVYGKVMEFNTLKTPVTGPSFARVDATLTDWTGKYLIVYEAQAGTGALNTYQGKTVLAFNGGKDGAPVDAAGNIVVLSPTTPGDPGDLATLTGGTVDKTATDVTVTGGKIEWREDLEAAVVTIAAVDGGWSIQTAGGYYLGNGGNNGNLGAALVFNPATHVHTISIGDTDSNITTGVTFHGCAIIQSNAGSAGSVIRVNANTGRFGYWGKVAASGLYGQHPVALYKSQEK